MPLLCTDVLNLFFFFLSVSHMAKVKRSYPPVVLFTEADLECNHSWLPLNYLFQMQPHQCHLKDQMVCLSGLAVLEWWLEEDCLVQGDPLQRFFVTCRYLPLPFKPERYRLEKGQYMAVVYFHSFNFIFYQDQLKEKISPTIA